MFYLDDPIHAGPVAHVKELQAIDAIYGQVYRQIAGVRDFARWHDPGTDRSRTLEAFLIDEAMIENRRGRQLSPETQIAHGKFRCRPYILQPP